MNFKMKLRNALKPQTRGAVYAVVAMLFTVLAGIGVVSTSIAPAIAGVVLAIVTLAYAWVNSDSTINKAIYGVCAAIGALLITLGYTTDAQINEVLAFTAPVLGVSYAAARTPRYEDYVNQDLSNQDLSITTV